MKLQQRMWSLCEKRFVKVKWILAAGLYRRLMGKFCFENLREGPLNTLFKSEPGFAVKGTKKVFTDGYHVHILYFLRKTYKLHKNIFNTLEGKDVSRKNK